MGYFIYFVETEYLLNLYVKLQSDTFCNVNRMIENSIILNSPNIETATKNMNEEMKRSARANTFSKQES